MAELKENKTKVQSKVPRASVHGMYYHLSRSWRNPSAEDIINLRKKMIDWRAGSVITKLEHPTRLDRARILGYKAKKGFLVFRVVLVRGGRHKKKPNANRRTKRQSSMKILRIRLNKFPHRQR